MSADKPSQSTVLVSLAKSAYTLVMSEDGRPYGVRHRGPNLARPFKGRGGLRAQLAKQFTESNGGQVPSASALADAMAVLEGIADSTDPVPVSLRVAGDSREVVIDLGTADGACVVINPDGWSIQDRSPVLFRRSGAMAPMPRPDPAQADRGLDLLRDLLDMDDAAFHQLVAWLVAAWIPHIPHPVLTFKGEQGTGKSKAAHMVVNLIDPSPASKRSMPRDIKAWATQAFNSWALCLDNVSLIQPWLSDTLCKAVTGDGIVDRALYSDDDVVVLTFRRVLVMTTIDAGALAGDLAERMMLLELQVIPDNRRRSEEDLDATYAAARSAILAALLDLLAAVLRKLPSVRLARMPRMADFARVLAAVDAVRGWSTLADYTAASENVSADALEGDPFGSAVVGFITAHGAWSGTAGQLLDLVPPPDGYHPKWPKDATRAGGQLKRIAPLLRSVGITFDDTSRTPDRARQRLYRLTSVESCGISASAASAASATAADQHERADATPDTGAQSASAQRPHAGSADAADAGADTDPLTASATSKTPDQHKHTSPDAADAADAEIQQLSTGTLRCPVCGNPVAPELTAAGHLTHPDC